MAKIGRNPGEEWTAQERERGSRAETAEGTGDRETRSQKNDPETARVNEEWLGVETPASEEIPEDTWEPEDTPVEPLTADEVLNALEFVTEILAEVENDPGYKLDERERTRMVPFLTEKLNQNPAMIRAVRTLDFFDGWGLVAYGIIRRGVRYYRRHFEKKPTAPVHEDDLDQETGVPFEFTREI